MVQYIKLGFTVGILALPEVTVIAEPGNTTQMLHVIPPFGF